VLANEKSLTQSWGSNNKYELSTLSDGKTIKQVKAEFAIAYENSLNHMVEHRMKDAITAVSSFWYTAWMLAGQPDLKDLKGPQ
jgi:hypothetical protein